MLVVIIAVAFWVLGCTHLIADYCRTVDRLSLIVVFGELSIYRSADISSRFLEKWATAVLRGHGRIVLIDGEAVRVLKKTELRAYLTNHELMGVEARLGPKWTICVVRNNHLVQKAQEVFASQKACAENNKQHPQTGADARRRDDFIYPVVG